MTRQPRLLDSNLREVARPLPAAMSATLDFEGVSSASVTLAEDGPAVRMHDWFEVFTPGGSAGLFRVTNIDDTKRQERVLTLMHGIDTLNDSVWRGATDYDGTVAGFLAALLSQQAVTRWQLGTCADTGPWKRSGINYDKLADLLNEVREDRLGYYFSYDFTTSPWTLNFLVRSNAVTSEFRLTRNVESCRITYSDSEQCNRLYLSVSHRETTAVTDDTDLQTTETEIKTYNNAASQATYGILEKTADIDLEDVPDADAWAAQFLAQRADPAVRIIVDGYALREITGEEWDEAKLGQLARVALPDYGQTLEERVVSIDYPELQFKPGSVERVTVELANHLPKFSESIANLKDKTEKNAKAGRGAARGGGAGSGVLKNWSIVTQKYSDMLDATGVKVLYESGIEVDAQAGITLYSLTQGFTSQYAAIKVNSNAISAEVSRATKAEGTLSSRIEVEAGRIGLLVEGSGSSASIKLQAITDGINNAGSSVIINADKIYLDASTNIKSILTGSALASKIYATTVQVASSGTLQLDSYSKFLIHGSFADWKSKQVVTGVSHSSVKRSGNFYFVHAYGNDLNDLRTIRGSLVTGTDGGGETKETLYYLGRDGND